MSTGEVFEYTVRKSGDDATVTVWGEIDAASGPSLTEAVTALTHDGVSRLVIDLDHVTFIDSRGLSALLESHRAVTASDMQFAVVNAQPTVQRLFRMTGIDAVLTNGDAST